MADDNSLFDKMIEMGMGMTMASKIPQMMDTAMPNQQQGGSTPPPVSSVQFYAYINNSQVGPLSEQEFITLIQKGAITSATQVWKAGMQSWMPASQVPETGKLLLLYSK